ncbi:MAG TPA: GNAT family N-acetyltransferase [Streptosporangiaceae bacterium]|nr:GNAT family N-acetyltransferase [Streptosporangiaceae bacterium]
MGFTGLNPMPDGVPGTGGMEVGWRLARQAWHHDYATEAARATVEVGLTGVGMDQIWSMTAVLNLPSQAVMRRIGMTFHSHFDHPAVEIGHAVRPHVAFLIRRPGIRAGIRAGGSPAFVGGR